MRKQHCNRKYFIVPGMFFGDWEILSEGKPISRTYTDKSGKTRGHSQRTFECLCVCGKRRTVQLNNLMNGKSTNCGCYRSEKLQEGWKKWRKGLTDEEHSALKRKCVNKRWHSQKETTK